MATSYYIGTSGWHYTHRSGRFYSWSRLRAVYVSFDNDEAGYAACNALELKARLHEGR